MLSLIFNPGPTTYDDALTESGVAADALVGGLLLSDAIAESVAAADSLASSAVWANLLAEAGGAADTVSAQAIFANALAEAAAAADALTGSIVVPLSESGAATDSLLSVLLPGNKQRSHGGAPTVVYHQIGQVFDERLWENAAAAAGITSRLAAIGALREQVAANDAVEARRVTWAELAEHAAASADVSATASHRSDDEEELLMAVMLLLGRRVSKSRRIAPLNRERDVVVAAREHIRSHAAEFLAHVGTQIASAVRHISKASREEDDAESMADAIDYKPLKDTVQTQVRKVAKDAAHRGLEQVGGDIGRLLEQVNHRAVAWAEKRAGELVTEVSETTRARVRELVKQAEEEGWSNDELADAIAGDGVFSDARALKIARTEVADADVQGNLIGWKESGVVAQKEFAIAQDSACDVCEPFDGLVVGLEEGFPEGDPPIHPNCRCDVVPVLSEEEEA